MKFMFYSRVIDYKQPNKHTSHCLVISIALGRNQGLGKGGWGGIACRGQHCYCIRGGQDKSKKVTVEHSSKIHAESHTEICNMKSIYLASRNSMYKGTKLGYAWHVDHKARKPVR